MSFLFGCAFGVVFGVALIFWASSQTGPKF